jgi:Fe-S oxidoreductase
MFQELYWREDKGHCCGAGGGMTFTNPAVARATARRRLQQAAEAGAATLVTACPLCEKTFADAGPPDGLHVVDLLEYVADCLPKKTIP